MTTIQFEMLSDNKLSKMTKISKNCTSFHTIPFHFNSKIIYHPGILFTVYYDSFLFKMDNTIMYIPSTYRHGLTALPVLNSLVCTHYRCRESKGKGDRIY